MKPSNPSSSTFSSRLPALLEKCSHWDKDERYMATNDLRLELLKGAAAAPLDEAMEAKVCACVIKQLEDASNDVQAVAVQTLGVLFRRVRVGQVERFADKLCDLIIQGKTSLRDIYAICLRNLLTDVPEEVGAAVAERIALRLLGGISGTVAAAVASASGGSRDNDTELKRECIDTLSELLLRFGPSVSEQHPRLVDALVARLDDEAHILRKRAAVSIGALATSLSDDLLAKLVHAVVSRADRPGDVSRSSTSVHALGMITRSVGRRLRTVMRDVMPVFLRFSEGPDALAEELQEGLGDSEGGAISRCDMVEFCLGGLEAAVRQCPRETRPYLAQIVDRGCAYLTFDPNYNYAVEDVELDRGQDDYGGDYGYDDAGGDQDFYNPTEDDDASWKLRRAAARVLSAVALRGVQALGGSDPRGASSSASSRAGIVGRIGDALTSRIVERVEAVKIDVLETIEAMMLASPPEANYGSVDFSSPSAIRSDIQSYFTTSSLRLVHMLGKAATDSSSTGGSASDARVTTAVLGVHRALCILVQDVPEDSFVEIIRFIETCIRDSNQVTAAAISLTGLETLRAVAASSRSGRRRALLSRAAECIAAVSACISGRWHKLVSVGLQVLESFIDILFLKEGEEVISAGGVDYGVGSLALHDKAFVYSSPAEFTRVSDIVSSAACEAISMLVLRRDADPDTRCALLSAIGNVLCMYGPSIPAPTASVMLNYLVASLESQETRLASMKAICLVGRGNTFSVVVQDAEFIDRALASVEKCLRLQDRSLSQWAIRALSALVARCSERLLSDSAVLTRLLAASASFINDSDGTACQFALHTIGNVFSRVNPNMEARITSDLFSTLVTYVSSTPISDAALREVQYVLLGLSGGSPGAALSVVYFERGWLLNSMSDSAVKHFESASLAGGASLRPLISQVARCIAVISAEDIKLRETMVGKCISEISRDYIGDTSVQNAFALQLSLYILAEYGKLFDLSTLIAPRILVPLLLPCLKAKVEDTKSCAVLALAHATSSNTAAFVPEIISLFTSIKQQNDADSRIIGLLLNAIKELIHECDHRGIVVCSMEEIFYSVIVPLLSSSDEGVRGLAAECIGAASRTYTALACRTLTDIVFGTIYSESDCSLRKISAAHLLRVALSSAASLEALFSATSADVTRCLAETFNFSPQDDATARRATLNMLHAVLSCNASLFLRYVSLWEPFESGVALLTATVGLLQYKMERVIDLGPFKHKIDDGLVVRRAALSVLEVVVSMMRSGAVAGGSSSAIATPLQACLVDKEEIQVKAYNVAKCILRVYPDFHRQIDSGLISKNIKKTLFPEKSEAGTSDGPSEGAADRSKELHNAMIRFLASLEVTREGALDEEWDDLVKKVASNGSFSTVFSEALNEFDNDMSLSVVNE